jgi:3-oxoacyl-[acyl-carrier-protein] synthase-1
MHIREFSIMNALGTNEAVLKNWAAGTAPGLVESDRWLASGEKAYFGTVPEALPEMPEEFAGHASRNNRLLLACFQAREAAFRREIARFAPERVGVILGTSTSGSDEADRYFRGNADSEHFHGYAQELGDPSRFLSQYLGLKGISFTVSTACTSSTRAFVSAARLIRAGILDAALVGGADTLARMPINGFNALGALSRDICRPFAGDRHGITIGEAAGLFFMARDGGKVRLLGYGETSDGYHMTAPDPEGKEAAHAMQEALERAHLAASNITYLNLHGTGTALNDAAEARAVQKVFPAGVLSSSTKMYTGHTLGAAGCTEAGLLCLLLTAGEDFTAPKALDAADYDPALPAIGYMTKPSRIPRGPMMTNNFAFGGNNVSLIFGANND